VNASPGLSCEFVQGLLFPGYAYGILALWTIPGATLQAEDHLRVAFLPTPPRRKTSCDLISADRHSIILQFPFPPCLVTF